MATAEAVETTGQRLRAALERRGMKARAFADAMGEKPALVSHWMTDTRPMRAQALTKAAKLLGVNRAWLAADPETLSTSAQPADAGDTLDTAEWYLRQAPEDGGRDYGNSNIFATPPNVETLVREVGQNSGDQAARAGGLASPVHMRFTLIELTKDRPEFRRFLDALHFDQLRSHIERAAQSKSRLGTKLAEGLRRLDEEDVLVLLRIDDYGTTGLEGEEPHEIDNDAMEQSSPYAALVRNNLDSSKLMTTAGGSFGLGKAVLWNCSDLSTVLFASSVRSSVSDRIRVVGKTELAWHRYEQRSYAGPGWFGRPNSKGSSLWIADPAQLEVLQLARTDLPAGVDATQRHGTSALIVGFRDPEEETRAPADVLLAKIAEKVAVYFFPLMLEDRLRVTVEHFRNERRMSSMPVNAERYVPAHWHALQAHRNDEVVEELSAPGDVARRSIRMRVPGTREDAKGVDLFPDELEAQCVLVVRLADHDATAGEEKEDDTDRQDRVALVRGRGMVTEYLSRANLIVGARPFHAVLLAGEAVSTDAAQLAAEQFLRLAEPPAHDRWEFNDELRGKYRRGSKRTLHDLKYSITEALREVLKTTETPHDDGPDELKRLLQFSVTMPQTAPPATLRNIRSTLIEGAWHIEADVNVNDRTQQLRVTPRLWIDVESGGGIPLPWASLDVRIGRQTQTVGTSFEVPPNARGVSFSGISLRESEGIAAAHCRAKLDVAVDVVKAVKPSRERAGEN